MKLLLDENLSDRIVAQILDLYPNSAHVKSQGLMQTDDALLWSFAQQHGYTIVSKLRSHSATVAAFESDPDASILILP